MSEITIQDARDLSVLTRDEAMNVIIRLQSERDELVKALNTLIASHTGYLSVPERKYALWDARRLVTHHGGEGAWL